MNHFVKSKSDHLYLEALLINFIDHNYIIKCNKIDWDSNVIYFPYYSPLRKVLNNSLDNNQLIIQLIETLSFLERYGIIHGDIKIDNLLYNQGKIVVIDFDLILLPQSRYQISQTYYYPPHCRDRNPFQLACWALATTILLINYPKLSWSDQLVTQVLPRLRKSSSWWDQLVTRLWLDKDSLSSFSSLIPATTGRIKMVTTRPAEHTEGITLLARLNLPPEPVAKKWSRLVATEKDQDLKLALLFLTITLYHYNFSARKFCLTLKIKWATIKKKLATYLASLKGLPDVFLQDRWVKTEG